MRATRRHCEERKRRLVRRSSTSEGGSNPSIPGLKLGLLRFARNDEPLIDFLSRKQNLLHHLRHINPSGKSLLIFRNRVKAGNQKYSASRAPQINGITPLVSPDERGGSRSSRTCGGMRWTRWLRRRTLPWRTVKSCGPDAPLLASSFAGSASFARNDGDKQSRSPGRARYKP